jgi:hypothetical protein
MRDVAGTGYIYMKLLRPSSGAVAALMLALLAVNLPPASAVPLDPAACEELREKLETLRSDGAAADMARGPDWARANLAPDRLQRIGTLLEMEEQLNFRCGIAKARITLPTTIEGGEEDIAGPGEATVEGTQRTIFLPQKAPPAPKRPVAATTPAAAPTATREPAGKANQAGKGQEKAAPPSANRVEPRKKAPAKKPKPQADDAYRPPPRPLASDGGWAPTVHQ